MKMFYIQKARDHRILAIRMSSLYVYAYYYKRVFDNNWGSLLGTVSNIICIPEPGIHNNIK